jgi:hypothetical protein
MHIARQIALLHVLGELENAIQLIRLPQELSQSRNFLEACQALFNIDFHGDVINSSNSNIDHTIEPAASDTSAVGSARMVKALASLALAAEMAAEISIQADPRRE